MTALRKEVYSNIIGTVPTVSDKSIAISESIKKDNLFQNLRNNKITSLLLFVSVVLLLTECFLYFSTIKLESKSNKFQNEIVKLKENNYILSVNLAEEKKLDKVESKSIKNLKMISSQKSKINYVRLNNEIKNVVINKKELIIKKEVLPLIGY